MPLSSIRRRTRTRSCSAKTRKPRSTKIIRSNHMRVCTQYILRSVLVLALSVALLPAQRNNVRATANTSVNRNANVNRNVNVNQNVNVNVNRNVNVSGGYYGGGCCYHPVATAAAVTAAAVVTAAVVGSMV